MQYIAVFIPILIQIKKKIRSAILSYKFVKSGIENWNLKLIESPEKKRMC